MNGWVTFVDSLNRLTWPAAFVLTVLIIAVAFIVAWWIRAFRKG